MENKIHNYELIYINKGKFKNISLFWIILIVFFSCLKYMDYKITEDIIHICCIILCLSTMLIAFVTSNYVKHDFFLFTGIAFLFIAAISILHIEPNNSRESLLLLYNHHYYDISLEFSEGMFVYWGYKILNNNISYKKANIIYVFCTAVIFILQYNIKNSNYKNRISIEYIVSLITIFTLFFILFKLRNKKCIEEDKVCYFKLFIFLILISDFLNLFVISKFNKQLLFLINIGECFAYSIIFTAILDKLFNKPYNLLFTDLYKRNEQLYEINRKIINRNKELEKLQEELKESESTYKNLFNNLPLPIAIINRENSRVIYANKSLKELFKLNDIKKIINKNIKDIVNFKEDIDENINKTLSIEAELKNSDKNIQLEVRRFGNNVILDENILIFQDITDDKNIEYMKSKVEKKKLEEKIRNDFLSNISHDLKTPVNIIYSAMQLQNIFLENDNFESIKKYNRINKENCMTLIRLTNNLIDCSKINNDYLKPQFEIINIVDLIENTVTHMVEYSKSNNIKLIFDTDEEEIFVLCDRNFMERIILNLVSNSIKYTKAGVILVTLKIRGVYVDINVEDNGKGMDEKFLQKAFNKYSIEEKHKDISYRNSGIGLYVVKNLVELQGGIIKIESKKDRGTKVIITFMRECIYEF